MLPQKKVIIAIPTFKRPEGIKRALASVEQLQIPVDLSAGVLVVDNDAQASAKPIVEDFAQQSRFEVFYFVEPNRGLSNVRNRILQEAINLNANYLAGIDDDETATPDWLVHLWSGLKQYSADCVGGAQQFIFPEHAPNWMQQLRVFKPYAKRQTGKIVSDISTGNYLVCLVFIKKYNLRFSDEYNTVGGGDSDFFTRCAKQGAKIVWIQEALVTEVVPISRTTLRWIIKRHYRVGYGVASLQEKARIRMFLNSLLKLFIYPFLSLCFFILLKKNKGVNYFFRFFFHIGKLTAFTAIQPYREYKNLEDHPHN